MGTSPRLSLTPNFQLGVQRFNAACLLLTVLLFSGCSFEKTKVKAHPRAAPEPTQAPAWNWDSYPPISRMRFATLPCQLLPKSTITMVSPLMGTLRVYATAPQTDLSAGFLWAEFEPEIFAAEEAALSEARKKIEDQEKLQWEIEYPKKKMQVEQQLEEAQRQVNYVKFLNENTNLAAKAFGYGGISNLLRADALDKAQTNLHLIRQTLAYLESTNYAAIGIDLAGMR